MFWTVSRSGCKLKTSIPPRLKFLFHWLKQLLLVFTLELNKEKNKKRKGEGKRKRKEFRGGILSCHEGLKVIVKTITVVDGNKLGIEHVICGAVENMPKRFGFLLHSSLSKRNPKITFLPLIAIQWSGVELLNWTGGVMVCRDSKMTRKSTYSLITSLRRRISSHAFLYCPTIPRFILTILFSWDPC